MVWRKAWRCKACKIAQLKKPGTHERRHLGPLIPHITTESFTGPYRRAAQQKCTAIKLFKTTILFSHGIFNLPHPACCCVSDPLSSLLTSPLPTSVLFLFSLWRYEQTVLGCKDRCRHLPCKTRTTWLVHKEVEGRMAACGLGHSRWQSEERPEAKNCQEAARAEGQQQETSNTDDNKLLDLLLQYTIFTCLDL